MCKPLEEEPVKRIDLRDALERPLEFMSEGIHSPYRLLDVRMTYADLVEMYVMFVREIAEERNK